MKQTLKLGTAILMLMGLSNAVKAQVTVNTAVGANVVEAITLTETSEMHFGSMTSPTTAATVILTPFNTRTNTGTITLLAQAPLASSAAYTVTGTNDATYAIVLPASITISNGTPAEDMTVNTFTCSYPTLVGAIDGFSGTDLFSVGATLILANAQVSGIYAGSFNVSVAYN